MVIGGDRNDLVGVTELYLRNMENPYQDVDDDASILLSINTSALIFGEHNVTYGACLFYATYQSATVIELGDPGGQCAPTDADGGIAVYKSGASANLYVKNRFGSSKRIAVQVIHGRGM